MNRTSQSLDSFRLLGTREGKDEQQSNIPSSFVGSAVSILAVEDCCGRG